MGEILNQLLSGSLSFKQLLAATSPEALTTLAIVLCLILLAIVAALMRQATLGAAALLLGAVLLGLQVLDAEGRWRAVGFAGVTALMVLMIFLSERNRLIREMRREFLDMDARFDSFLTALERRHALLEERHHRPQEISASSSAPLPIAEPPG
ncbi:hypothetical protein ABLE91_11025 [Aquabacter sp. CN5-332]|uniref:hypothetical protein n=1 Tax=Aquabacter sp. CN5-332 TaxID=3156608 RepID=UPI0032B534ED